MYCTAGEVHFHACLGLELDSGPTEGTLRRLKDHAHTVRPATSPFHVGWLMENRARAVGSGSELSRIAGSEPVYRRPSMISSTLLRV